MPGAKKNFIGLEGFIWWMGVVEDRNDPEQLGRVRVRCFGWHTEKKQNIPTDALPWAHPVVPVNNPNAYTPKEGDMVFGFFIDGENAQNPAIMGVLPGKPDQKPNYENGFSDPAANLSARPKKPDDPAEAYPKNKYIKEPTTNRLSRGKSDGTVIATRKKNLKKNIVSAGGVSWSEPAPAFAPKYPYNNALETESGHALEFDDTPGKERVHVAHRNGSYIEMDSSGNRVERIQKDNYSIVMGADYVYIDGRCSVTVGGDCNLKVGGNMNAQIGGGLNISAGGDVRIKGKGLYFESVDQLNLKAGSSLNAQSSSKASIKGSSVAVSGSSLDVDATLNVKSGTNLKATGSDSRGDSHNLSVTGSGASGASSATGAGLAGGGAAPTSEEAALANQSNSLSAALNSASALENIGAVAEQVLSGVVPSIGGIVVGKDLAGITASIGNLYPTLVAMADNAISGFIANSPIGELTQKVLDFEATVNEKKGEILSLRSDLQNKVLGKIDEVATRAIDKNIDFNIDTQLVDAIDKSLNKIPNVVTKIGKQIYPKTETIQEIQSAVNTIANTSINNQ